MQMKKLLLYSFILLFFWIIPVNAYETIIIDFPQDGGWHPVFYQNTGLEAILQYVPGNESKEHWTQTIIIHSYKDYQNDAKHLSDRLILQLTKNNPTGKYKYIKASTVDTIAMRSTNNYKNIKPQCELFRVTKAAESYMSIQYIDRNKQRYKNEAHEWYKIVSNARTYNSYWLDERIMNKGESFKM